MADGTDEQLLARYVNHGDRQALGALFARHADLLYTVALRYLGDATLAQDVAQETCLLAAHHAAECTMGSLVKHWLLRIAVNQAINTGRKEQRLRKRHAALAATQTSARDHELLQAVEERIALLDEDVKTPLILHYYDAMTQQDIATLLGCSQKTVHQRMQKGLEQLRVALTQSGYACATGALTAALAQSTPACAPAALHASLQSIAATASLAAAGAAAGATVVGGTLMSVKQVFMISTVLCILSLGLGYIGHEAVEQFTGGSSQSAGAGYDDMDNAHSSRNDAAITMVPASRLAELERQTNDEISALQHDLAAARSANTALQREVEQLRQTSSTGKPPADKNDGAAFLASLTPEQREQLKNTFGWIQQARPDVYATLPIEEFVMQEYVCLNDTMIGPEHRASLGALKLLPKLNSINFAGALLGDDDLRMLEGISMVNLYVHDTTLTDEGVRWMAEHFPDLQHITLANTRLTDKGMESLCALARLRALMVWNCDITDAGVALLARLTQLETLNLSGCEKITDASMASVARLANLASLSIGDTAITDAGLAKLGELRLLDTLTLNHTKHITGTGLAQLGATRLRVLNIADSVVTFDAFEDALAVLGELRQVNAKNTQFTEQDLHCLRQLYPNVAVLK